ncbi:hemerythrin domain-containing protein [Clostridium sp. YIM B02551]|uniref:hemerythrin domain-containing protein n=1 Tax=Clostridium sp. YIM B02551 TaxID=2910679 RepID=UPI001EEA8C85|nr:hemerythrin domain-containing protein [Clostridium sp. YIM B02551]
MIETSLNIKENKEIEIYPTEDLMREHGVMHRMLLIYNDALKYLSGQKMNSGVIIYSIIYNTAMIAQQFIEDYHQRLEEQYVFPKLSSNPKYSELINTLLNQHNAARKLTNNIIYSSTKNTCYFENKLQLIRLLSIYINMYDPHSAREDTVIFPAFHEVVNPEEFKELGDLFEKIEEQKFGEDGFKHIVNEVANIEKELGIYNLNQFTPIEISYTN